MKTIIEESLVAFAINSDLSREQLENCLAAAKDSKSFHTMEFCLNKGISQESLIASLEAAKTEMERLGR